MQLGLFVSVLLCFQVEISAAAVIGTDDQQFSDAIALAKTLTSVESGRPAYITAPPGKYFFTDPIDFGRVKFVCSTPMGRRACQFIFTDPEEGETLVTFAGGHGGEISNIWVTSNADPPVDNLTAFKFAHCASNSIHDLDCFLEGQDCIGYVITDESASLNMDSVRFVNISARCSMPLHFYAGDNCQFINLDLTCEPETSEDHVWAGIQGNGKNSAQLNSI